MITLVIEASTYQGSVAVLDGAALRGQRIVAMRGREHEALMPAVGDVLEEANLTPVDVRRIVCGAGPGAFTSLRIGGAIAKGLAVAVGCPLVPVSSLALLVASVEPYAPGRYLAAVDAMRGEHYVQLLEVRQGDGLELEPLSEVALVASALVDQFAASHHALALGPDRSGPSAVTPRAAAAARITKMLDGMLPSEVAGWEPGYGRLAEAQVKWEAVHGRPLTSG